MEKYTRQGVVTIGAGLRPDFPPPCIVKSNVRVGLFSHLMNFWKLGNPDVGSPKENVGTGYLQIFGLSALLAAIRFC